MPKVIRDSEYNCVRAMDELHYNAHHVYHVYQTDSSEPSTIIKFQEGPIKENGSNGCQNEDLIAIVIDRLQCFQKSEFNCRENSIAITKLEEALMWLEKRTANRKARGVEGTQLV